MHVPFREPAPQWEDGGEKRVALGAGSRLACWQAGWLAGHKAGQWGGGPWGTLGVPWGGLGGRGAQMPVEGK